MWSIILLLLTVVSGWSPIIDTASKAHPTLAFEIYCTRFAPSKAVLTLLLPRHPKQSPSSLLQLHLESTIRRRTLSKLYSIPHAVLEVDFILPSWSLQEGAVSRVSVVHVKTGEVLSNVVVALFGRECEWPRQVVGEEGVGEGEGEEEVHRPVLRPPPIRPPWRPNQPLPVSTTVDDFIVPTSDESDWF